MTTLTKTNYDLLFKINKMEEYYFYVFFSTSALILSHRTLPSPYVTRNHFNLIVFMNPAVSKITGQRSVKGSQRDKNYAKKQQKKNFDEKKINGRLAPNSCLSRKEENVAHKSKLSKTDHSF